MRALQLLNERAEQRAAYWRCTVCDEAFATGHEYRCAAKAATAAAVLACRRILSSL